MPIEDAGAYGVGMHSGGDEAIDRDVRGFTGLLVGLAVGIAVWGLILMLWWLV